MLAIAGHGFAQESNAFVRASNGSPDGLYAIPDATETAGTVQDSTSNRAAQSYLRSLDPQGERFQRDLEKAESMRKAAASAKRLKYLAAGGDSDWSLRKPSLSERAWTAILAGVGLLVSLAAAGYVWWSRSEHSRTNAAVLLAVKRQICRQTRRCRETRQIPQTLRRVIVHSHQHPFCKSTPSQGMNINKRSIRLYVDDSP